jgi:hypothetical protein
MVLQDGQGIGCARLSIGRHAEPIDLSSLEKIEVVKARDASLWQQCYWWSRQCHYRTRIPPQGQGTYISATGGSNNWQGGGSGGIEYGTESFLLWANAADNAPAIKDPLRTVMNSYTRDAAGQEALVLP